mgnify:CR=1 FL=1
MGLGLALIMGVSKYHTDIRGFLGLFMALPAKTGAAGGRADSAEIQMAPDALLMKGFLPIKSMPGIMAGRTLDMGVAGIEFHGIQDIILLFVINMVAVQTVKFRHVHVMRKGDGIPTGRAVFLLHRTGV